jgi:TonB family protein
MNGSDSPVKGWSVRRWFWMVVLIFLIQVGFILALGRKSAPPVRVSAHATRMISVPESVRIWPASLDPTLFVRPQRRGFAGGTWLVNRPPAYEATDYVEQLELLPYAVEDAGRAFLSVMQTNAGALFDLVARPGLRPATPATPQITKPLIHPSTVRLEDELRNRPLISRFELPAWRHNQLLRPTVVQLTVDGLGRTISAFVTESSGYDDADDRALELARQARFEPVRREGVGQPVNPNESMLWGRMIFEWQTLPSENEGGIQIPP